MNYFSIFLYSGSLFTYRFEHNKRLLINFIYNNNLYDINKILPCKL